MKARSDENLVQDILASISEVRKHAPPSQAEFDAQPLVQSHILRHIQIIGEASWRLTDATKALAPTVPWRRICNMRHVLVHDYHEIDWKLVFEVAVTHVADLQPRVELLASQLREKS